MSYTHPLFEECELEKEMNSHLQTIFRAQSGYILFLETQKRNIKEKLNEELKKNSGLERDLKEAHEKIMHYFAHRRAAHIVHAERDWRRRHGHSYNKYDIVADGDEDNLTAGKVVADGDSDIEDTVDQPVDSVMNIYRNLPDSEEET